MMTVRVAGGLLALVLPLAGCGGASAGPGQRPPAGSGTAEGRAQTHVLHTHCGVRETRFDGDWWVTEPGLDDGSGNPPAGWDNPQQRGTMRLLPSGQAEFRDGSGHVVVFTRRPGADGPLRICR